MFIFQKRTFVRRKEASTSGALACLLAMMRTKSAASMCSRGMIISWFAIFDQVPWNLVYFACMNFKTQGKSRKIRLFHLLVGIWIFAPKLRPLFLTSLAYYYLERQDFCAAAFRRRSSPWWCWTKVHSSSSLGVPPKHLNFGKSGQSQSVNYVSFLVVVLSFSSSLSLCLFRFFLLQFVLPSFLLEGGFLVAQFVRIDLDPSHWPFISAMAFSASTFLVKETKP